MADPNKPSLPKEKQEEKDCVVDKTSLVDVTAMIRSLQRREGLRDCYRRGFADCDQLECSWRRYCLGAGEDKPSGNGV